MVIRLDGDADHLKGGVIILGPRPQPGKGTGGAIAHHQVFGLDALLLHLAHELGHRLDIPGRADHPLAAHGDVQHLLPLGLLFRHQLAGTLLQVGLGFGGPLRRRQVVIGGGIHKYQLGIHQAVQQQVAGHIVRLGALEHQDGLEAVFHRSGHRQAAVVGLDAPKGHQGGVAVFQGIGHQVVQLPGLVAPQGQAGQVVPFDIEGLAFQFAGEMGEELQRCVAAPHFHLRQMFNLHRCLLLFN